MRLRSFAPALALVACAGCGTKIQEQYQIDVVTPGTDDNYLAGATKAVLEIGTQTYTSSVTPGAPFVLSGSDLAIPASMSGIFRVKVLDAQGQVVAQGQSPEIELLLSSPPLVRIFIQKPGSFGRTRDLDFPRRHMVAVAAPAPPSTGATIQAKTITVGYYGLGTATVPADNNTTVEKPSEAFQIYNPLTHFGDDDGGTSGTLGGVRQPRTDAAAVTHTDGHILVFGGTASPSMMPVGPSGQLDIVSIARTDFEVFSPSSTVRSPEPPMGIPRARAAMVEAGSDIDMGKTSAYAIGGQAADQALDTIVKIDPSVDATFTVLPVKLAGPRVGHTATAVNVNGKDDVLIFGGAAANVPVAEVLFNQMLVPTMGNAGPPRKDHAAVALPNDRVIILGGRNDGGVLGDSVLYATDTRTLTPGPITLHTPRYSFAAFVIDDDLVVAGGFDAMGHPLGTAEIYSAGDLHLKKADVPCWKRAEPAVVVMPNESVLLLGGTEDGVKASAVIEIYQPLR
jgi:hypothetical protein